MECCMEARALKSSVRGELSMQKTQHVVFDDYLFLNGAVPAEDFSIDCFFDFSNGEIEEEEEEEKDALSISSQERVADDDSNSNSSIFSYDCVLPNELSVPDDEIAGLEWVSHFVDDSLPELPFPCPVFKQQSENRFETEPEPEPVFIKTPCFSSPVPSRARSKRAKPTGQTWSVGSMTPSESSSSTTTPSSISSGSSMTSAVLQNAELANELTAPPTKKQKKKPVVQTSGLSSGNPFQRRCSHCQVQKTPQWRAGPLGPKTLCNACGVRYKSGRLFLEYRPACSPTFSVEIHSNCHRKVLEMRRKKELAAGTTISVDADDSEF